jgi:hypothetical protein
MPRLTTAALAVGALLLAGCGDSGSDTPVEGQTTPPPVVQTTTTTPPATTPKAIDAAAQMAKLQPCVGGKAGETYQWFQPTVDYATSLKGGGFSVTLKGKPVTLIVFPSAETAQLGYKDIQDRLIALQQKRPTDYAVVAATAAQAVGNVLEVATAGALDPASETKVQSCILSSVA